MLIRLDISISDGGTFGGAVVVSTVVRVGALTFVTTVTICCDNTLLTPGSSFLMRGDGCMLSIRYPFVECIFFLPQRLLQARARQKGWTGVRIFGSVES